MSNAYKNVLNIFDLDGKERIQSGKSQGKKNLKNPLYDGIMVEFFDLFILCIYERLV